ncbi:MAG: hypothetical protein BJ554DRAFT_353, partial [Olpidium bornovanus]
MHFFRVLSAVVFGAACAAAAALPQGSGGSESTLRDVGKSRRKHRAEPPPPDGRVRQHQLRLGRPRLPQPGRQRAAEHH